MGIAPDLVVPPHIPFSIDRSGGTPITLPKCRVVPATELRTDAIVERLKGAWLLHSASGTDSLMLYDVRKGDWKGLPELRITMEQGLVSATDHFTLTLYFWNVNHEVMRLPKGFGMQLIQHGGDNVVNAAFLDNGGVRFSPVRSGRRFQFAFPVGQEAELVTPPRRLEAEARAPIPRREPELVIAGFGSGLMPTGFRRS